MGKFIYTYIENGQMYDKSPSFAELLAKEGLSGEKIVTGRIGYIPVENFLEKLEDAKWLVFTSKNAVAGYAYNMGYLREEVRGACEEGVFYRDVRTACKGEAFYGDMQTAYEGVTFHGDVRKVGEGDASCGDIEEAGAGSEFYDGVKFAVVGEKTQEALRNVCGLEADYVCTKATGMELGKKLMDIAAGKIVYLCAEVTSGSLEEAMKEYGGFVKIPVYRNEYVDTYAEYGDNDYSDVAGIIVTSGISGERIKWLIDKLGDISVYSIGPACSRKLVAAGVPESRIIEAREHSYSGMVDLIRQQESGI